MEIIAQPETYTQLSIVITVQVIAFLLAPRMRHHLPFINPRDDAATLHPLRQFAGKQRLPGFHGDRLVCTAEHAAIHIDKSVTQVTLALRIRFEAGLSNMAADSLQGCFGSGGHVITIGIWRILPCSRRLTY